MRIIYHEVQDLTELCTIDFCNKSVLLSHLTLEAYRSENSYLVTFTLFMISKNRPELP